MTTQSTSIAAGERISDILGTVVTDFTIKRPWRHQIGELRLMAAVLEDAIHTLRKRPRSRAGREVREWFASRDASWPFAFERVCDALDLDADAVRRRAVDGGRPANGSPVLVRLPVGAAEPMRVAESA